MPNLKNLPSVTENAELISIFKTAIRRKVWEILANQNSPAPAIAWAKRARTTFKEDRSDFYAVLAIEGLLSASAEFRAAVDLALGDLGNINMQDAAFMAFVTMATDLFILREL